MSAKTNVVNEAGQPRLVKFYTPLDTTQQQKLIFQVYQLLKTRILGQCNFLTPPRMLLQSSDDDSIRVIFRRYATLNFVFIVDTQESPLAVLDLIQVFVESLDRCFENVCELDLVFGWQVLEIVLDEIIQGGMVLETSVKQIVAAVDLANQTGTIGNEDALSAAQRALTNATSAFRSYLSQ